MILSLHNYWLFVFSITCKFEIDTRIIQILIFENVYLCFCLYHIKFNIILFLSCFHSNVFFEKKHLALGSFCKFFSICGEQKNRDDNFFSHVTSICWNVDGIFIRISWKSWPFHLETFKIRYFVRRFYNFSIDAFLDASKAKMDITIQSESN